MGRDPSTNVIIVIDRTLELFLECYLNLKSVGDLDYILKCYEQIWGRERLGSDPWKQCPLQLYSHCVFSCKVGWTKTEWLRTRRTQMLSSMNLRRSDSVVFLELLRRDLPWSYLLNKIVLHGNILAIKEPKEKEKINQ